MLDMRSLLRRPLAIGLLVGTLGAFGGCGEQRGTYNPFGSPDRSEVSGLVDQRPLNGK